MAELSTPSLSELLRTFRARAGFTQAALAEKAGLSEQAISVLERGTRSRPRADTVRALTQALALTAAEADQFRTVARGKLGTPRTSPKEPAADQVPTPWQLPPAAPDFTGRAAQVDAILSVLRDSTGDGASAVGLVTVTGMGGIGKTTLAVHVAHMLADSYPNGHLYLNLRGYGPGAPMSTTDAQRHLLRSLGSDIASIPDDVDEATALLRSQLAGRRVLLLLDNAADVAQVVPLLPGHAGSGAIITSRGSLANLPGARQILLDALSESESVDLLAGVIGPSRVAAEPDATRVLASYSGRLPLAIRLVGGRLATRPTWPIQHFVDLLQDQERRLDGLGSDETGVRASIASSVQFLETSDRDLDRQAAGALPLLTVPDGSDLTTAVAAVLLEVPIRRADAIVERLADLNLLESVAPARYRFHDLIRAYGREVAEQTLSPLERDEALARVLRYYTEAAWICQRLTHSTSPRLPLATVGSSGLLPTFSSREASLRWLDAEQRNMMDRFRQARQTGLADSVLLAELALALFGYHESRRRWQDMREMSTGAIELAQRHGRPATAAWLQHDGAIPDAETGAAASAIVRIQTALKMFSQIDDLFGQARSASSLAYLLGVEGQIDDALAYGRMALALSRTIQDPTLEGVSLTAVGGLYDRIGDFAAADAALAEGIALAERAGDTRAIFKRYLNAAFAHVQVRRYDDAIGMARRALQVTEQSGDSTFQAESHHLLAIAHAAKGDLGAAAGHVESGLLLARAARDPEREGRLHIELAKINAADGDRAAAVEQLNAALSVLKNVSEVAYQDAGELLEKLLRDEIYNYRISTYSI
ncbi:XRE family transcriptional regulator [Kribbella kalugense]|uniref:Transcriptional regulator with XRE-family HTH domain n=1 Tax=Kribbella kalugense TaxID=2512221 RepID=A0A4R7ZPH9_9ACTN|nr:XRE family transcriptional regulator [Kribbella kalugense]TDW19552.1 transcriptional regulator with XRE-family HTH domain [Kribbella kalugense]